MIQAKATAFLFHHSGGSQLGEVSPHETFQWLELVGMSLASGVRGAANHWNYLAPNVHSVPLSHSN